MKLWLERFGYGNTSTLGKLYDMSEGVPKFLCYILEDERRTVKVPGETCIPKGVYEIKWRKEGGFHEKYTKKFEWHIGMLHLQKVPGFKWVLIHPGNTEKDTAGCLLPGTTPKMVGGEFQVSQSTVAYKKLYLRVAGALERDEEVYLSVSEK